MDSMHPYVVLLGIAILATCSVIIFWLYSVCTNLYQDFMHFSRRFRGIE
jgi:hypothetical protein